MRALTLIMLVTLGCSEPEAPPLPTLETPMEVVEWPASPQDVPGELRNCITEYRDIARRGLPTLTDGMHFSTWYSGPFQAWTARYNTVRARCDGVAAAQDEGSAGAQFLLATQSYMHERLAVEATVFEEEPQMFLMATYWSLGAACTYQSCQGGPERAWTELCTERAQALPACPPIEPEAPQ